MQIKLNRMTRRVSVDGQVVVRTCASGSLKYHKHHDIDTEVKECTNKWLAKKKLVATTVSSRGVWIKRRSEGTTVSGHEEETVCADQKLRKLKGGCRQSLKHVDGDVAVCITKVDKEWRFERAQRSDERERRRQHIK